VVTQDVKYNVRVTFHRNYLDDFPYCNLKIYFIQDTIETMLVFYSCIQVVSKHFFFGQYVGVHLQCIYFRVEITDFVVFSQI
jgi:hypothetical protein